MRSFDSLQDRDVLVTGANGFIGSNLVDKLVSEGSRVLAFARSSAGSEPVNLDRSREEVDLFLGDLRDPSSVRDAVKSISSKQDVLVFHLGAQAHVGDSWEIPRETMRTNVLGTVNLLEELKQQEVDVVKINIAGSSEEYGRKGHGEEMPVDLDEDSPLAPKSVYATSKLAQDFLGQNYHEAYGMPVVVTRMFNNYGPRQSPRYITGTVITQALERERVELGDLKPKRDMCFVDDGVRGHLHAALEGEPGEVYTFGKGESISMESWVEKILEIGREEGYWQDTEVVQEEQRFRPGSSEVKELKADYSKLNDLTGWQPRVSWDEGLRRTVRWYAENSDKWSGSCDWK